MILGAILGAAGVLIAVGCFIAGLTTMQISWEKDVKTGLVEVKGRVYRCTAVDWAQP